MRVKFSQSGDTIIEVMLAFTVFAVLAVGTISIMNRGVASAQDALETTLVRQQMDGQAETLRFLYQSYADSPTNPTISSAQTFATIIKDKVMPSAASKFGDPCVESIPGQAALDRKPFLLNPRLGGTIIDKDKLKPAGDASAPAYAQIIYDEDNLSNSVPYGLWIEAVKGGGEDGASEFIDFHIRACWNAASSSAPRTLGTIVRLYLPTTESGQLVGIGVGIPQLKSYKLNGNQYNVGKCVTFGPQEQLDSNPQTHTLFDNSPPHSDGASESNFCQSNIPNLGGAVRSCVNYDTEYDPNISSGDAGLYKVTIRYLDSVCNSNPAAFETIPPSEAYDYHVALYVDGNLVEQGALSSIKQEFTYTTQIAMNEDTKIQLRWWNNRFTDPGGLDPDFTINQVIFDRIPGV